MHQNPSAVYVFAPQGAGKTRHAQAIARLLGCTQVFDDWDGASVPDGALVLASAPPAGGFFPVRHVRVPFSSETISCTCAASTKDECECLRAAVADRAERLP